jgi:4-amino-4-deoxy-L-arabinose transferase-like glycosyltransferase
VKSWAAAALVAVLTLRLWVGGTLGLSADEAYYWTWSQALDWGYYDHPPGVAWLIRAGTAVIGDNELGVRAGGLVVQSLAFLALLFAASPRDRSLLVLLLLGLPVLSFGGLLATPDALLLAGWAACLLAAERGRWGLAGACAGVAILAKLTGVLLLAVLALAGWRQPERVARALAVAFLVASPWVYWSIANSSVSIAFQLQHGLVSADPPGVLGILEFFGGQIGAAGPVIFLAGLALLLRGERTIWWWSAAIVLAVFGVAASRAHGEIGWAAPAWLGVAVALSRAQGVQRRAAWAGGWISAGITALITLHAVHPIWQTPGKDPVDRLRQGQILGPAVQAWGQPVLTARYQEAAWIRFYGGVAATTIPGVHREDQFDLWPRELPESAVYVRPAGWSGPAEATLFYRSVTGPARVVARRGDRRIQVWEVWLVSQLREQEP